jgi:hypothetical protein
MARMKVKKVPVPRPKLKECFHKKGGVAVVARDLHCTESYLRGITIGKITPSPVKMHLLCIYLGVEVSEVFQDVISEAQTMLNALSSIRG